MKCIVKNGLQLFVYLRLKIALHPQITGCTQDLIVETIKLFASCVMKYIVKNVLQLFVYLRLRVALHPQITACAYCLCTCIAQGGGAHDDHVSFVFSNKNKIIFIVAQLQVLGLYSLHFFSDLVTSSLGSRRV